jgi:non-homologous end joining protein Ku
MTVRATRTKLAFGLVTCEVALYRRTGAAERLPKWETAGPNGGELLPPDTHGVGHVERSEAAFPSTGRTNPSADGAATPAERSVVLLDEAERDADAWVEQGTGTRVRKGEERRGIRAEDGEFIDLTDEIQDIADHTALEEMRIADFIRAEEVQRDRCLGSYFVAPTDLEGAKAIRLMFEGMRAQKRVAVVKYTLRSKQALGVLAPHPATKSLILTELAWKEDLREIPVSMYNPGRVEVDADEVLLATELVEAMSSTRAEALDTQEDDARRLRRELVDRAYKGETFTVPDRPEVSEGAEVIELIRAGLQDRDALAAAAA